jgi:transcriptional regulator with XRE-family HTH domain
LEQKDRVKALRKHLNLTQDEFAKRIGIKYSALSKIENGENALTDQNMLLICTFFGVNDKWLREGGPGPWFNDKSIPGAKDLIDTYRELEEINRNLVLDHAHYLLNRQKADQKGETAQVQSQEELKKAASQ